MAACCAVGALIIYHLMSIHSRLSKVGQNPHKIDQLQTESGSNQALEPPSRFHNEGKSEAICRVHLEGITCQSCISAVEEAVSSIFGVQAVSASLLMLSACVVYDARHTEPSAIARAVDDVGFGATVLTPSDDWRSQWLMTAKTKEASIHRNMEIFRWSAFATGLIFASQFMRSFTTAPQYLRMISAAEILTATICVTVLAAPIHRNAYFALKHRQASSSLLSSSGLVFVYVAALQSSLPGLALENADELGSYSLATASMLLTVVLGGQVTKSLVTRRSADLPIALASVLPNTAVVVSKRSGEHLTTRIVPVDLLHVGDEIVVEANAYFPADCTILEGTTSVLETVMKGEISSTLQRPGDEVLAGCLNCERRVIARVTRVGKDTWLGQTLSTFEHNTHDDSAADSPSERLLATFSVFVLGYAAIVGSIYLAYQAPLGHVLTRVATILLCACPCTLGLGIPICFMAASLNSYDSRVLLRPSRRIENAAGAHAVVFDKTGTLTHGALRMQSVALAEESIMNYVSPEIMWGMICEMTKASLHPVSVLLHELSTARYQESGIEHTTTPCFLISHEIHPGLGQSAVFDHQNQMIQILVGNARMMQLHNVFCDFTGSTEASEQGLATSMVYIAVNGKYAGRIQSADTLKAGMLPLIKELHSRGLRTYMMTGDSSTSARKVGSLVGIPPEHTFASLLPQEKAALITKLEQQHGPIIMVGDNLNDAAALTSASFGIVVANDSPEGRESGKRPGASLLPSLHAEADGYLLPPVKSTKEDVGKSLQAKEDDPNRILYILDLINQTAFRTRMVMKWSLVYNVIALTLASGVLTIFMPKTNLSWVDFGPTTASLAMSVSSLCNLRYALALGSWRPPDRRSG